MVQLQSVLKECKEFLFGLTLEPFILLQLAALGVLLGSEVQTNLLLWKVCHLTFGHNETVCDNLDADDNDAVQDEVQKYVTNFKLYGTYLAAGPGIVYSLFAGALSDKYGRKPLLLMPVVGAWIAIVLRMVNYTFIRSLPLVFFYFDDLYSIFGGHAIYYMGIYGFAADITNDTDRAARMARFDGMEVLAYLIGSALSPLIFNWGGNYATYTTELVLSTTALIYFIFFVKESIQRTDTGAGEEAGCSTFCSKYVITPFREFLQTMSKKRPGMMRVYLYILLCIYTIYWAAWPYGDQIYLYLLKVFPGFDGDQYAVYNVYYQVIGVVGLLIALPLVGQKLEWHETSTSLYISSSITFGLFVSAFVKTMWPGFYLARFFCGVTICQYSVSRSLFTKCVGQDEVGKIFSAVALVTAIVPILTTTAFKKLYNATLSTFPGAFLLLAAAMYTVNVALSLFLWCRREDIKRLEVKEEEYQDQGLDNKGMQIEEK